MFIKNVLYSYSDGWCPVHHSYSFQLLTQNVPFPEIFPTVDPTYIYTPSIGLPLRTMDCSMVFNVRQKTDARYIYRLDVRLSVRHMLVLYQND